MRYDFLLMIISILFITMGYAKSKAEECNGEKVKYVPYGVFDKIDTFNNIFYKIIFPRLNTFFFNLQTSPERRKYLLIISCFRIIGNCFVLQLLS